MIYISTVLIASFMLLMLVALPTWSHSRKWGYGPSGGLALIVLILVVLSRVGGF